MTHPLDSIQFRERHRERVGIAIGVVGTCLFHGVVVLASGLVAWFGAGTPVAAAHARQQLVFVDAEREELEPIAPKTPLEPEPVEPAPPAEPAPLQSEPPLAPAETADSVPAENEGVEELAEVGETLTVDTDADTFTVVNGDGDRYAGGESARGGTSKSAVWGRGRATPEPEPAVVVPTVVRKASPPVQIERKPWPKNGSWNMCRFPDLAKNAGLDDGHAKIIVRVDEKGRPVSVQVLFESPAGYGFGESARRCAMNRRYHPGRDILGRRVAAETESYKVRMLRNKRLGR